MTEHSAFGTFCFTSCNSGNVTGAGIDLQTNIRMLEGFIGIGSAAHSWFDMITLPAESRVSYLHIQSNASDRRKNKGIPVMVNFPVSSGSRLSGLTLQQKLYKMLFVCLKHNFCLMMVVIKIVRVTTHRIPVEQRRVLQEIRLQVIGAVCQDV